MEEFYVKQMSEMVFAGVYQVFNKLKQQEARYIFP
jgi:hypothetical protein